MRPGQITDPGEPGLKQREIVAQFENASRNFDGPVLARALVDVSFEVYRDEIFGLLGPPGSGKSTALKLLAGTLQVSQGRVRLFNQAPTRREVRRRVGFLSQQATFGRRPLLKQVIDFLRELFWLTPRPESYPPKLVSANQRRATLVHLLAKAPDLLLLDDPFGGLEPDDCVEMKQLISSFARNGKTIILSSASFSHITDICNRMALLSGGWIRGIGTMEDLLAVPGILPVIAYLLPEAAAHRALQAIRQDLVFPAAQPTGLKAKPTPTSGAQTAGTSSPEQVLDKLSKPATESASTGAPSESNAGIDHHLLSSLSRPASSEPPHSGADKT